MYAQIPSRILLSAMIVAATTSIARAEDGGADRPYAISGFAGACKSSGIWTQQALQLTKDLRNFTLQLKDDPNCRALGEKVQGSLTELAKSVEPKLAEKYSHRLSQLPQEISTLTLYLRTSQAQRMTIPTSFASPRGPQDEHQLMNALAHKMGEAGALAAQMEVSAPSESTTQPLTPVNDSASAPLARLMGRFARSSQTGIGLFNQVVDSIPQMQQCLTGDGVAGANIIATSVKLLTSFVASNQDSTGTSVATALSKLGQVIRETKFANVLTKLNQADFISSLACLIEISTENYCNTRDSKLLFDDMMKQLQARPRETEQKRLGPAHSLAGYYILSQNLPIISHWIQRVQIGVDPRVPTDAQFQNTIFDDVNTFFKKVKVLRGFMSQQIENMKTFTDQKSKQNQAREIIQHVYAHLKGGIEDGGAKNFFTLGGSTRELMFTSILGIGMPKEVVGTGLGQAQSPEDWLESNYMNIPAFQDPDRLVADVMNRVFSETNGMVAVAQHNAIQYYNKWFIIDKISLVNESLLGMNYNVKDSLVLIYNYLGEVEKRMRAGNQDLTTVGGMRELRTRIKNVLAAYTDLEKTIQSLPKEEETLTPEQREKVTAANIRVITSVYEEFEILLGKSGWFGNRFVKFVWQDYLTMLKTRKDFSENVSDLAYAAGLSIFDRLLAIADGNPANVQSDLATAMTLNKMNLEAVELLARDYFANMTAELQAVTKATKGGAKFEAQPIKADGPSRAWRDQMAALPGQENEKSFVQRLKAGSKFWSQAFSQVPGLDFVFGSDPKYTKLPDRLARFAIDDEFGSARRMFEQFCIQSLAFSDVRAFYSTCKDVVLKSPFPEAVLSKLSANERDSLAISYQAKLAEARDNAALNLSQRICAFRDFNRKNHVIYLTTAQSASAP